MELPDTATPSRIVGGELTTVKVSDKTHWIFLRLADSEGRIGTGEASLQRREAAVAARVATMMPLLLGRAADPRERWAWKTLPRTLDAAATASAMDHALWDLAAQRNGRPVAELLGARRSSVPLYANINRGLPSRAPEAFASAAKAALDAGFRAIKIAPFDEVDVHGRWGTPRNMSASNLALGLARVEAVRTAIGAAVDLMVDCHWRFDHAGATHLLDAIEPYRLYWLECPIPEDPAALSLIADLRKRAHRRGTLLAGGEDGIGSEAFAPFLDHGCYDVLMPDIKYVGGLEEMLRVAGQAHAHGVAIAPHNPSGPIAHAASTHVCTVLPGLDRLELQFAESPLFQSLMAPAMPEPVAGIQHLASAAGWGASLSILHPAMREAQSAVWGEWPGSDYPA